MSSPRLISPVPTSRGKILLAAALIVAAGLLAYSNSFAGAFIFDDKPAILENPSIRSLESLKDVLSPPKIGSSVTGRPIVNLSFAFNYALSGYDPWSYHAANLGIHLLAALALFGIVRRTLLQPKIPLELQSAAYPLALVAAGLWVTHPLQTESVSSVVQRTESLVGLFYLLTLYTFIRGAQSERPGRWWLMSLVACFLGMGTKEVMVTAPFVVLCYDRAFIGGSFRETLRRRWPFHLLLMLTWAFLGYLLVSTGGTRGEAAGLGLGVTPLRYALTQCRAIALYLKLTVWPAPLILDYGTAVVPNLGAVLPQAALINVLLAATLWACVRRPLVGFLGLWFFVILAPSSSFVPLVSQTLAEHRMYLPLAAIIVFLVISGYLALGRGAFVAGIAIAIVFTWMTSERNGVYRSDLTAWSDTVAKLPSNARAQLNLAESLIVTGHPAEALEPAEEAVRLRPQYPEAQTNLGIVLTQLGRPAEALPHCLEAVRLQPERARNLSNLAAALIKLDRSNEAIGYLQAALRVASDPREMIAIRRNLGGAYVRAGRVSEGIAEYETVLRSAPDSVETHYSLGLALGLNRRYDDAIAQFEAVIKLEPDHPGARGALIALRAAPP